MFSRVTLLEVDTMRITMDEAYADFHDKVLPHLTELPGYEGIVVLATPDGRGMLVSFWESEEAAQASEPFAGGELERFVTFFRSPPGRERYEVVLADVPDVVPVMR
jgi:hypothetical protein